MIWARSQRYAGAVDIEVDWTVEAVNDGARLGHASDQRGVLVTLAQHDAGRPYRAIPDPTSDAAVAPGVRHPIANAESSVA